MAGSMPAAGTDVLPIGGSREKLVAAKQAGANTAWLGGGWY